MKYYKVFSHYGTFSIIYFVGTNYNKLQAIAKNKGLEVEEITEQKYILIGANLTSDKIIL